MRRRQFVAAATALGAGGLFSAWAGAVAAASAKRILMVTWRGETDVERGFRDYLARHRPGIEIVLRDADRDPQRLIAIAAEVAEIRPDLVYVWGTSAMLGMVGRHDAPNRNAGGIGSRGATPVVFALVADPVGAGILPQLIRHGRAITGVSHMAPIDAQIEVIRRYRPLTRLGILYNPLEENSLANVRELKTQAALKKFSLLEQTFDLLAGRKPGPAGIAEKIQALKMAGAEWLYVGPDSYLFTQLRAVAAAAREAALPVFATTEAVMNAPEDILAGLVSPYREVGEFAAHKAVQILFEGRSAADVPVETLKRFSLVVRLDVARRLKLLPPLEFFEFSEMRQGPLAPA